VYFTTCALGKAAKEVVLAAVEKLLSLKKQFLEITGQPFDAPKVPVTKPGALSSFTISIPPS
jgi:hypothetical protein